MKLNTKGFTAFEAVLIVLVIAALGFAGYTVYQNNKSETVPSEAVVTEKPAQESDMPLDVEAQKWQKVTSANKTFEVRIPDGWSGYNFGESDYFVASELTYNSGTPAKIESTETSYAGDANHRFSITVYENNPKDNEYMGAISEEKWEKEEPFSTNGLTGTKKYKQYPIERINGIGPYPGQKTYKYSFPIKNDRTLVVTYNIFDYNEFSKDINSALKESDPNQLELIERVIATLKIN